MGYNFLVLFMMLFLVIGAAACVVSGRKSYNVMCNVGTITCAAVLVLSIIVFISVINNGAVCINIKDIYIDGINFKVDGFRSLYCLIFAFMWFAEINYSKEYMKCHKNCRRYYFFMLVTLAAVFGVFLSDDFLTAFLFFEIMSLTSYTWVAQEESKEALYASSTYLYVSLICGLVMLMGLFILKFETGTLMFDGIHEYVSEHGISGKMWAGAICILIGYGAKAGMYPVHVWLPKAHPAAPAPASALLSGALTKCGIYGVLVMTVYMFEENIVWGTILLIIGVVTMLTGAVLAIFSGQLKRTLACSSMSQIGFITVGMAAITFLGTESEVAVKGTMLHMINHSLIKLVLFTCAGMIYTRTHSLLLNDIRGAGNSDKFLKFSFITASCAISGIPLFSGYISKTLIHEGLLECAGYFENAGLMDARIVIKTSEWLFLIAGGLTAAYMIKLCITLFTEHGVKKAAKKSNETLKKGELFTRLLISVTSVFLIAAGVFPDFIYEKAAKISQSFFMTEFKEKVLYFSLENLKGAAISITVGAAVYVFIIRKFLINAKGEHIIKETILDIEKDIYRPVFGSFLPFIGAFFSRIADLMTDTVIAALRSTVYRPAAKHKKELIGTRESYAAGLFMNVIVRIINATIRRKNPIKKSFVELAAVGEKTALKTTKMIVKTVSFGLLMFSIGLLITILYLLFGI